MWRFLFGLGLMFSTSLQSTPARAAWCGGTTCPAGYQNLHCYDAGKNSEFEAKICLAPPGGPIVVTGDILAVLEPITQSGLTNSAMVRKRNLRREALHFNSRRAAPKPSGT
jgi:hypothetical protein